MTEKRLRLLDLADGFTRVTPCCGGMMAECASLCLAENGHPVEVSLTVTGSSEFCAELERLEVTEQMLCYDDLQDATEQGAVGVAFLLVRDATEFQVVRRSRKGTGFDYWLGDEEAELPFDDAAKLEVSGILKARPGDLKARTKQKLKQAMEHHQDLETVVVIVDFGQPAAELVVAS